MDVRCDRCHTEYEFEESRLTEAGVAVKCTACGNVFKVRRTPAAAAAPIELERPRQWKVRRNDGQVYALKDLPELQRWIVERRVSRDDEVSLSGDAWRQLGSMPELASFFEVVEAAEHAQRAAAAVQPQGGISPTMISPANAPTPAFGRPAVAPQSKASASWEKLPQSFSPAPTAEPAWTASPSTSAVDPELAALLASEDLKHVRGSRAPAIIITLLVLGAAGGGIFFLMKQAQKAPVPVAAAPVPNVGAPTGPTGAPGATVATGLASTGATAAGGGTGATAPTAVAAPSGPTSPIAATGPAAASSAPTATAGNAAPTGGHPGEAAEAAPKPTTPPVPEAKAEPKTEPKAEAKADAKPEGEAAPAAKPKATAEGGESSKGHDFGWYLNRGRKLLDTHPSQAVGMFEQASQLNSSSPEPDSGRGIAYSNLEQWPKAISAFQTAIKKSPEFNEAVMGLAEAYRYSGNKKEALVYYKRYLDLTPDGPDAPAAKAQIQSLKGE